MQKNCVYNPNILVGGVLQPLNFNILAHLYAFIRGSLCGILSNQIKFYYQSLKDLKQLQKKIFIEYK